MYQVTYLDNNGEGFSKTEPWILGDYDNRIDASIAVNELLNDGYKDVKLVGKEI